MASGPWPVASGFQLVRRIVSRRHHADLGNERLPGFFARAARRAVAHARRKTAVGATRYDGLRFRAIRGLERRAGSGRLLLHRNGKSRPAVSPGCRGQKLAGVDFRSARDLCGNRGFQRRGLCGNVAGRKGVSHRERQGKRIFLAGRALYLGIDVRSRRLAVRGDRR